MTWNIFFDKIISLIQGGKLSKMEIPLFISLIILIVFSAFFSCSETAYTSLSHVRIERLAKTKKSAKLALKISNNYDRLLNSILIGNNIVNIAASTIGTLLFITWVGAENGPTISTIVLTIVILVFGETTPKSLAKEYPESVALMVVYPLYFFYILFYPLTVFFDGWKWLLLKIFNTKEKEPSLTEDEFKMIVSDIKEEGVINQNEHDLIQKSIIFDDQIIEKIMTPWDKVVKIYKGYSDYEIKEIFEMNNYSRVPYVDKETNQVLGLILQKDFYEMMLEENCSLESIVKPPLFAKSSTRIADMFKRFQKVKQHLAIILDNNGNFVGVLSLEDILEELVGEIEDEYDAEDMLEEQSVIKQDKIEALEKKKKPYSQSR